MQEEEWLSALKESRWKLRKGNKSLINHHVVLTWRTPVTKNDQTKGKRGWKHKVNPCTDLDESLWWNNWKKGWNSGKKRKWHNLDQEFDEPPE